MAKHFHVVRHIPAAAPQLMHSCNLLKNRVSACARRLEAAWLIRLKDTFTWRICSGLAVQESDFHAPYIFMEGLEPANLDMALSIASVTDTPDSVAAQTLSENAPVCPCTYYRAPKGGGGGVCEVSDDTGGVIPPTSASNLQHEKDTVATLYLPPAVFRCPSSCPVLLFQPKSAPVSGYRRFQPQLPIKYTSVRIYSSLLLSPGPPPVRSFTAGFPLACYSSFFVKQ